MIGVAGLKGSKDLDNESKAMKLTEHTKQNHQSNKSEAVILGGKAYLPSDALVIENKVYTPVRSGK